jgi:hypothetical protein
MDHEFPANWADPSAIPDTVRDNVTQFRDSHGTHDHPVETVRTTIYHGHRIVVRTRYSVEIDGRPLDGHLGVTDDGAVHYHALPNYSFGSALDLVKQVVDSFPDDFGDAGTDRAQAHNGGRDEHHGHRG